MDEIENPNPAKGTNNWYTEDGYGGRFLRYQTHRFRWWILHRLLRHNPAWRAPIVDYLKSLPNPINPNCETGHYYLLNNYNPGFFGNGNNAYTDNNAEQYTIHHSTIVGAEHWRQTHRRQHFVEVLRRPVE